MKRKTNVSVQDNMGVRKVSNMIVSSETHNFASGDILDANAVMELILSVVSQIPGGKEISSEDIVNGTILIEDLSEEVTNKLESVYEEGEESLYIDGSKGAII